MEHSNLKPILSLTDSLSELFFNISTLFTDIIAIGIIAIMCNWTIQFKSVIKSGVFTPLIIMLTVDFIIVAGIIYPLIVRRVLRLESANPDSSRTMGHATRRNLKPWSRIIARMTAIC